MVFQGFNRRSCFSLNYRRYAQTDLLNTWKKSKQSLCPHMCFLGLLSSRGLLNWPLTSKRSAGKDGWGVEALWGGLPSVILCVNTWDANQQTSGFISRTWVVQVSFLCACMCACAYSPRHAVLPGWHHQLLSVWSAHLRPTTSTENSFMLSVRQQFTPAQQQVPGEASNHMTETILWM